MQKSESAVAQKSKIEVGPTEKVVTLSKWPDYDFQPMANFLSGVLAEVGIRGRTEV